MVTPSVPVLEMARSLLAASQPAPNSDAKGAVLNENLRLCLTRLTGADALVALLRRAVALARAQMPILQSAKVDADGRIEDLDRLFDHDDPARQGAVLAITAQLLELLVAFIGEPLTRRLVREALSEIPPEEAL
jgi:hypothetical protein